MATDTTFGSCSSRKKSDSPDSAVRVLMLRNDRLTILPNDRRYIQDSERHHDAKPQCCFSKVHPNADTTSETPACMAGIFLSGLVGSSDVPFWVELEGVGIDFGIIEHVPN